jgi:hypothetical protein
MAQINVRDEHGAPIPRINIRIAEDRKPSDEAIYDVFTDLAGNAGWPIPFWPRAAFTLHVNTENVNEQYRDAEIALSGDEDNVAIVLEAKGGVVPVPVEPDTGLFLPERGHLRIDGATFRTESGELWQWRGYSWFLGFLRYCRGEDVTPDLRWMRAMGFNIPRIFGPLPWKETPDYRIESFQFDKLSPFLDLLEAHGLRSNWSLGHYRDPGLKAFAQKFYDIAAQHWSVVTERVNEPHVGKTKPDPITDFAGVDRHGVLTSYGYYAEAMDGKEGWPKVLDFGTIHTPRDSAWHRKARMAQEVQHATGKPWISDEPAKIIEVDFDYPGGKNDPQQTPIDAVWHAAIAAIYTAGSTVHTEFGKWAKTPPPGSLQQAVVDAVRDHVFLKIGPIWQEGKYKGSHSSGTPVHFERDIWAYSSILRENRAISVRVKAEPSQPENGWQIKERWGPGGSLAILEK